MPHGEKILGLADYEIKEIEQSMGFTELHVRYTGRVVCPHCGSEELRSKDRFIRTLRHESWGLRLTRIHLEARKYQCKACRRYFNQRFPGVLPRFRSTEPFRREIFWRHFDGICRSTLAKRAGVGTATVERWFIDFLGRQAAKLKSEQCPRVLGIDEHFFTKKKGYATTLCDLRHHKVFDVVLGRSEASLEPYFKSLKGKEKVQVVCIDLASNYRKLIRKYFPQAKIVADRFHVIRLLNQYFMQTWREIDPAGSKHRGLVSLIRRHPEKLTPDQVQRLEAYFEAHPAMKAVYDFKQDLHKLLRKKTCTAKQCRKHILELLDFIQQLKTSGFETMQTLGKTFANWSGEIAAMWRFSKNNGITEGFHNKMEMLSRRAFGFRNFQNYRLRVRVMCS